MTYDKLIEIWREEVGVTEDDDLFSQNDIVRFLGRAASEIAAALRFPVVEDATATAAQNATSFTPDAAALDIVEGSVQIRGSQLEAVDWYTIKSKGMLPARFTQRYYHYDRDRTGSVEFAPATAVALGAGDITYSYVADPVETAQIDPGTVNTATVEPWGGAYPDWHYLIPLRAGVFTYEALELYERAQYFDQRSMTEIQKMAGSLFRIDIAQRLIAPLQRYESRAPSGGERSPTQVRGRG